METKAKRWQIKKQQAERIIDKIERKIKKKDYRIHCKLLAKAIYSEATFTEYDRISLFSSAFNQWPLSGGTPALNNFLAYLQINSLCKEF